MEEQQPQQDIFNEPVDYIYASQGNRFANFLVDNLFIRFVLDFLTGYVVLQVLQVTSPELLAYLQNAEETDLKLMLFNLTIVYFDYLLYYTFCEWAFKGYTIGKMLTRTKVVRVDGKPFTIKDAAARSLCRIVPFEVFSALGNPSIPWHDRWTNTRVVEAK